MNPCRSPKCRRAQRYTPPSPGYRRDNASTAMASGTKNAAHAITHSASVARPKRRDRRHGVDVDDRDGAEQDGRIERQLRACAGSDGRPGTLTAQARPSRAVPAPRGARDRSRRRCKRRRPHRRWRWRCARAAGARRRTAARRRSARNRPTASCTDRRSRAASG